MARVALIFMTSKKALKSFYRKCKLTLKPNPQWRLYKFQLQSGAWYSVPNQIRDEGMLRQLLIRHTPINVFSTVCTFLNPLALENENYKYASRLFLTNDSFIFIDIDEHNIKLAQRIKEFMESQDRFELWEETDSGNGIHQYYYDNKAIRYRDPLRKMDYQLALRERLVNQFKKAGIEFDYGCLTDLTRVSRVIGTPNDGNLKKVCKILHNYKGLQRRKADESGGVERLSTISRRNIQKDEASSPPSPSPALMKFSDAMVQGIKNRYIPFVSFYKTRDWQKRLEEAVEMYDIGNMYVFSSEKEIMAFSLKIVDKNRYQKILKRTKARYLRSLLKFGHVWIRTSATLDATGQIARPKPKFEGVIHGGLPAGDYSRPHLNLLKKMGARYLPKEEWAKFVGAEESPIKIGYDGDWLNG